MANPKRRISRTRRDKRRAHDHLKQPNVSTCSNCGEAKRSHRVCPACGHYRGREVIEVEDIL
ncbi:MAG: 50S ribosomal protein L32 [Acidobacteriota bacterium]